jgi:hypothetical protein
MCPARFWPKLTGLLAVGLLAAASIHAEPPGSKEVVRRDAQGDSLPPGALARLGTLRWRHPTGMDELAFTPDGKRLVGLGTRMGICWDAATGKELRRYSLRPYYRALLSPDGKSILHLEDKRLVQTDVGTGKESVTALPEGGYHGSLCPRTARPSP